MSIIIKNMLIPSHHYKYGFNVTTDNAPQCVIDAMFQPEDDEVVNRIHRTADWSDIAIGLGVFQSKTQARKNGWSGEIPDGYSERVTKKHGTIFVYKIPNRLEKLLTRAQKMGKLSP